MGSPEMNIEGIDWSKLEGDYPYIHLLNEIGGDLHINEGIKLLDLAKNSLDEGVIVEIGSYQGRSTCFLAQGSKLGNKGKVIAIDCQFRPEFEDNIKSMGLENWVIPIQQFSNVYANEFKKPIKLLFIDGCHDLTAVFDDIINYSKYLVKDGVIVLHDVLESKSHLGPAIAFKELIVNSGKYTDITYVNNSQYGLAYAKKVI
jgi:predicted O-methyltransferase YrrM